jgi:Concanavalin A-like lectin/glucanases superfamily
MKYIPYFILCILFLQSIFVLVCNQQVGTLIPQSSTTLSFNNTFPTTINNLNVSAVPTYTADPYLKVNTAGLIAWYRFDENSGNNVFDSSGLRHDSKATNKISWKTLKYNSACYFNGVNSSITLPSNEMTCNNTMSFACWFNTANVSPSKSHQVLISQTSGAVNRNYDIYLNGPTPTILIGSGSDASKISFSGYSVKANQNYFIAFAVNNRSCTMWIYDGKKWYNSKGTLDYVLNKTSSSDFSIGYLEGASTAWAGALDNMLIWNREITQAEVYSLAYDTSAGITAKTNSNKTYSSLIPANGDPINVPYNSKDLPISSLNFLIPSTTKINGISVYDYPSSISPLSITLDIEYNEPNEPLSILEKAVNDTYYMNATYTSLTDHPKGVSTKILVTDSNVINANWVGSVNWTMSDKKGEITYYVGNHTIGVQTGPLKSGQKVNFSMSMAYRNYYTFANASTHIIKWAGLNWKCKNVHDLGPGTNNFSDSPNNLWVDNQGRLHLTIKMDSGRWDCTQLACENDYRFGKFTWKIDNASSIFNLSQDAAWLGLFSYRDDNNETDVEISRWQGQGNHLVLYTVQPYWIPGNSIGYLPSVTRNGSTTDQNGYDGSGITVSIDREPNYIDFTTLDRKGRVIAYEHFTNTSVIDKGAEKLYMNFYLRSIPTIGPDVECIIDSLKVEATPV